MILWNITVYVVRVLNALEDDAWSAGRTIDTMRWFKFTYAGIARALLIVIGADSDRMS